MTDDGILRNPEPTGREVWYASSIVNLESPNQANVTLNRYKNKIYLDTYTGIQACEFIKKSQIYIPESADDSYYFVDASKRRRPDLISYEIYGTPLLYWVILSCNDLATPLELETNMTLRCPSLSALINNKKVL